MNAVAQQEFPVPDHVPPELVRSWDIYSAAAQSVSTAADPFQSIADMRTVLPRVFWSTHLNFVHPGAWYLTRVEDMREVMLDTQRFSNRDQTHFSELAGESWPLIPLEVDPPAHTRYRSLLNPLFSPQEVARLEDGLRADAGRRVAALRSAGGCEFVDDFARPFPILTILGLLGLPADMLGTFLDWEYKIFHAPDLKLKAEGATAIASYLKGVIRERRARPGTDFISRLMAAELDGRRLDDQELLGMAFLMFAAGLDTVTSALGLQFLHLARDAGAQRWLRANPQAINDAVEEMLRAFPIVTTYRRVTRDTHCCGVDMKAGDVICLPTPFAGRDITAYPEADAIRFDRDTVRHITFAYGPHRCMGSHLARRELQLALEIWLREMPPFAIAPGTAPVLHPFSVDRLQLAWPRP
ncbi:MAG: cytochrome P450 [Gammaproteobacteria bacterium]